MSQLAHITGNEMEDQNIQLRRVPPQNLTDLGFKISDEGLLIHRQTGAAYKIVVSQGGTNISGDQISAADLAKLVESAFHILEESDADFQNLDRVKVGHEGLKIRDDQLIKKDTFDAQYQKIITISSRIFPLQPPKQERRDTADQPDQPLPQPLQTAGSVASVQFAKESSGQKPMLSSLFAFLKAADDQALIPQEKGLFFRNIMTGFQPIIDSPAVMRATTNEELKEALMGFFSMNQEAIQNFNFSIQDVQDILREIKNEDNPTKKEQADQFLNSWKDRGVDIEKHLNFLEQTMAEIQQK